MNYLVHDLPVKADLRSKSSAAGRNQKIIDRIDRV